MSGLHKSRHLQTNPGWILSAPGVVVVFLVTQSLFAVTIIFSTLKWNVVRPDLGIKFVGISNFIKIFTNVETYTVLFNTLYVLFVSLVVSLTIGFCIALLLNREFRGSHFLRGLMLLPFFMTEVAVGILFKTLILHPSFGIAGYLASGLGVSPIDFFGSHALFSIIFLIIWQWTPFFVLILLAGLQGLNVELQESASIDGASKFQVIFHVIIPNILYHIRVAVLLGIIFILKVFGLVYVTTSGGPGVSTTTLPYQVFKINHFKWEIGEAAAYAIFMVFLTLFVLTAVFKLFQKIEKKLF